MEVNFELLRANIIKDYNKIVEIINRHSDEDGDIIFPSLNYEEDNEDREDFEDIFESLSKNLIILKSMYHKEMKIEPLDIELKRIDIIYS